MKTDNIVSKKFELVKDGRQTPDPSLYRIRALRDFGNVKKGELGGYVESEDNLSHKGNAWIADEAKVTCGAHISGNALVTDHAMVSGRAQISGEARIGGWVQIGGELKISGRNYITAQRPDLGQPFRKPNTNGNSPRP